MAELVKINVESAEAVLGLHWFVAKEEGLFEEEGMEVEIFLPGVRATKFATTIRAAPTTPW